MSSMIDDLDDEIIKLHRVIAKKYQNKTYKSKNSLAKILHGCGSSLLFGSSILYQNYFLIPLSLHEGYKFLNSNTKEKKNSLDIFFSDKNNPSKFDKFFGSSIYMVGSLTSLCGASTLMYGMIQKEPDTTTYGFSLLTVGLGIFSAISGNYLDRIEISKPPKKTKKENLKLNSKEYNIL
jgi:hypothetical protein